MAPGNTYTRARPTPNVWRCGLLPIRYGQFRPVTPIGQQSSQVTGNGGWVSGNNGPDQTTYPGSRAALVHQSNTGVPGQHNK